MALAGPDEAANCALDCGCTGAANNVPCNDGDPCTSTDLCLDSICTGGKPTDCSDGDNYTTDSCDTNSGCQHTVKEVCNGIDDNGDGQTDVATCNGGTCFCKNGVWICPVGCTSCPDYDDVAVAGERQRHRCCGLCGPTSRSGVSWPTRPLLFSMLALAGSWIPQPGCSGNNSLAWITGIWRMRRTTVTNSHWVAWRTGAGRLWPNWRRC
jgi:hypothetical protein